MSETYWYRLEMLTPDPELESAKLWDLDATGIEVQDSTTFMEDGSLPSVPEGITRLIAYFARAEDDAELPPSLKGRENLIWERYDDTSWATAWKAYFKPQLLSPRIIAGPPWEEFDAPDDGVKVEILPGMAFGTGTHETTRLCAAAIDRHVQTNGGDLSMLDVGCGSAILSIASHLLGVRDIRGIDLTEDVIAVARENVEANGIDAAAIDLSTTRIEDIDGMYDLVVANILAHILEAIRDDLVRVVSPGGTLILCGVTQQQRDGFRAHFDATDLSLVDEERDGDWVRFEYRRP